MNWTWPQDNIVGISAGYAHVLARYADGTVKGVGSNGYGECTTPANLGLVAQVAGGYQNTLFLLPNGTVKGVGYDGHGEIDVPGDLTNVVAISFGDGHGTALSSDGKVRVWGYNYWGQLNMPANLSNVIAIDCSHADHTLCLLSNHTVTGFGLNNFGQLNTPPGLSGVVKVAAGSFFSLALKSDGTVVAWGNNAYHQCEVPSGLNGVVDIAAGHDHAMALLADGTVVCWGSNAAGQCSVPSNLTNVVKITAGYYNSVALRRSSILSVSRNSVVGGSTQTQSGTFTLNVGYGAAQTLSLTSSDPSVVVPAHVTVPAGATKLTFSMAHTYIGAAKSVQITATCPGVDSATCSFALQPFSGTTIKFDPASCEGGLSAVGVLTLNATAKASVAVQLSSSDGHVVVPGTVHVSAGSSIVTFPVTTTNVAAKTVVEVRGYPGGSSAYAHGNFTVLAAPMISTITFGKSPLLGHQKTTLMVTLREPAHAGGNVVALTTNVPGLSVPTSLPVAEGQLSATTDIIADDIAEGLVVTVTASSGPSVYGKGLRVNPIKVSSLTGPVTVAKGSTFLVTVTLTGAVDADTLIPLSSSSANISVPGSVTVPAGSSHISFTATVSATAVPGSVKLTAAKNGSPKTVTIKIAS